MFSDKLTWDHFDEQIKQFGKEVVHVPGGGFCLIESIRVALKEDFNINYTNEEIADRILDEICERCNFYKQFHTDSVRELVLETHQYLKERTYTHDVVDVVTVAVINALKFNLNIYQRNGNSVQYVQKPCLFPSDRYIFLKYDRQGGAFHAFDHYAAVVNKKIRNKDEDTNNTSPPKTNIDPKISTKQARDIVQEVYESDGYESDGYDYFDTDSIASDSKSMALINAEIQTAMLTTDQLCDGFGNLFANTNDFDDHQDIVQKIARDFTNSAMETPNSEMETSGQSTSSQHANQIHANADDVIIIDDSDDSSTQKSNRNRSEAAMSVESNFDDDDDEEYSFPTFPEEYNQRKDRPRKKKYRKRSLDYTKFNNVQPEYVDKIPWDISGIHIYKIKCSEDQWVDRAKDGRWWVVNTSSRKGFNGFRRTGYCKGSLVCENVNCSKLLSEGVVNTNEFLHEKGLYTCKSCGCFAVQKACGCLRTLEYDKDTGCLTYMHQGTHCCTLKPDTYRKINYIRDLPINADLRGTNTEVKYDLIMYYLANDQIAKAFEVCTLLDDDSLLEKIRYSQKRPNMGPKPKNDVQAFTNIGKLRQQTEKIDEYLIYSVNCREMSGKPSHCFKTSKHGLELAMRMDERQRRINGKKSSLSLETAFFDGMHSRCKGYKTLTMWVHHPGMRRMRLLAAMECEREDKYNISLFFQLFNQALQKYSGIEDYKFNPAFICMDEAGANMQAIVENFGQEFYMEKVAGCQWHFKKCAEKQIHNIREQDRKTFRQAIHDICLATTYTEYKKIANVIESICRKAKILHWWNWWKVRRYHLVPALRGFGWTGTNWAEIGQSTMKPKSGKKVWLSYATYQDVCTLMLQELQHNSFINNRGKVVGRGPTSVRRQLAEKQAEERFIESAVDVLESGNIEDEILHMGDNEDARFIPNVKAKHRIPKVFPKNNPLQKDLTREKEMERNEEIEDEEQDVEVEESEYVNPDEPDEVEETQQISEERVTNKKKRKLPTRAKRGRNPKYDSSPERGPDDLDKYDAMLVPKDTEKAKMDENPPVYVKMWSKVSLCSGCDRKFADIYRKPPNDLIFRYRMHRKYFDKKEQKLVTTKERANAYFHAKDLACLHMIPELEDLDVTGIYIENHTFRMLTDKHKEVLKRRQHYDQLRETRRELIDKN